MPKDIFSAEAGARISLSARRLRLCEKRRCVWRFKLQSNQRKVSFLASRECSQRTEISALRLLISPNPYALNYFAALSFHFHIVPFYFRIVTIYFDIVSIYFRIAAFYFAVVAFYFEVVSIYFDVVAFYFGTASFYFSIVPFYFSIRKFYF